MKKDVFITIKGIQFYDDEQDAVELSTVGLLYRRGQTYYICYDESETTGFVGAKTILKVEGDRRVTMRRTSEKARSQLIIEKGARHQCFYNTDYGSMTLGISGDEIHSQLDDCGGQLDVRYTLDINASMASENELSVNVKEYTPENLFS